MKTKTFAQRVFHPLLAAAILLAAGSVFAQTKPLTPAQPVLAEEGKAVAGVSGMQRPPGEVRESGIKVSPGGFPPLILEEASQALRLDDAKLASPQLASPKHHCPAPYTVPITTIKVAGDTVAPFAPDFGNGAIFTNATFGVNGPNPIPSFFGRTFKLNPSQCCQTKYAILRVVYFARVNGSPPGPNSSNDTGGLVENGAIVPGSYGFIGSPTGTSATAWTGNKTVTYVVPLAVITSGTVSFQASDNTTVISATLMVNSCCLPPV